MTDLTLPTVPLVESASTPQPRPEVEAPNFDSLSDCRYCWGKHPGICPFIKVVEWHPTGQIARVVLKDRTEHEDKIIYADDEEEAVS